MSDPYAEWRAGVLARVAHESPQNDALLNGWALAESPAGDLMRWNNPLNTTRKWPGSWNSGAQPGPDDVQVYPDVTAGIQATAATLANGFYNAIVSGLSASQPPAWYQQHASSEFATWGTGAAFLANVATVPRYTGGVLTYKGQANDGNGGTQHNWWVDPSGTLREKFQTADGLWHAGFTLVGARFDSLPVHAVIGGFDNVFVEREDGADVLQLYYANGWIVVP